MNKNKKLELEQRLEELMDSRTEVSQDLDDIDIEIFEIEDKLK